MITLIIYSNMKRLMITLAMLFALSATPLFAKPCVIAEYNSYARQNAIITFSNKSEYRLTLKICSAFGGTYCVVELGPRSSRSVSFGQTAVYNLKIKATRFGQSSYHDGGRFSVTCDEFEWSEGEMVFEMSTHGSGLGPSISRAEFESDR